MVRLRRLTAAGCCCAIRHLDSPVPRRAPHPRSPADDRGLRLRLRRAVRAAGAFRLRVQAAAADLAGWLRETGLTLHSVHAPIAETLTTGGGGGPGRSPPRTPNGGRRRCRKYSLAVALARIVPYRHLVVHVGVPDGRAASADNQREAARRALEEIEARAAEVGVSLALEVIPNALSTPEALVRLIEEDLESDGAGACLDLGHAHLWAGPSMPSRRCPGSSRPRTCTTTMAGATSI